MTNYDKVKDIILDVTGLKGSEITNTTSLYEDVFSDYLDRFLVAFELEEAFGIEFNLESLDEDKVFETIQSITKTVQTLLDEEEAD